MNYFDETAEKFLQAEKLRKELFLAGIDNLIAKAECREQLQKPFIQTQGYNEFSEVESAMYLENL